MKNIVKEMLFVMVIFVGIAHVSNNKVYAAQQMTASEMNRVTGQSSVAGQWCGTTSHINNCVPGDATPANGCYSKSTNAYPNCTAIGAGGPNPAICYNQSYTLCIILHHTEEVAEGQYFCSLTHYTVDDPGHTVVGCHP